MYTVCNVNTLSATITLLLCTVKIYVLFAKSNVLNILISLLKTGSIVCDICFTVPATVRILISIHSTIIEK